MPRRLYIRTNAFFPLRGYPTWVGAEMAKLLSLGTNQGEKGAHLRNALRMIESNGLANIVALSHVYETAPWGKVDQPWFWNLGAEIETAREPLELLNGLKSIEQRLGRGPAEKWGPRIIDIDIVLWDDVVLECDGLTLPHPEFRQRAFVLVPLAEIAPDVVDPVTRQTVRELAERPEAAGEVKRLHRIALQ